jgi:prevent-host-death family protein
VSTPARIGIRELRQHASRWVQLAEEGQRVEITNRGRLVAALVPIGDGGDALTRLEREGRLTPATAAWGDLPDRLPTEPDTPASAQLLRELGEDRL